MSRPLSSSLLRVLALTLVFLQGALAFIEPGRYIIVTEENRYLTIDPDSLFISLPDLPARLLKYRLPSETWEVKQVEGGYTIRQSGDHPNVYGLVNKDGAVFVSARPEPQTWAVGQADVGVYTIRAAYKDLLLTQFPDDYPQVLLKRADGLKAQRWILIPIIRDSRALGRLYGKSRFNSQCAM
ncbi:hypothetical protein BGX24_004789 [Mortierella sp. AD032]|nr:hypothetical protein BGX24_004789 [Mortierella sp. AD032]